MPAAKKQLKLTKIFRKGVRSRPIPQGAVEQDEECIELQREIEQIRQELKTAQHELSELMRSTYIRKLTPVKKPSDSFVRPQKIILSNAVETLKSNIDLMSLLTGFEVQSYVLEDNCVIVYNMQHKSLNDIKHGLKINMKSGASDIAKCSLPLGFNISAVVDEYDNVKSPECLVAVRKALVAFYNRQEQYEALQRLLNIEAKLFRTLDGLHVEIEFRAQNGRTSKQPETDEGEVDVVLALDYRIYDIRPKVYSINEKLLPEDVLEVLMSQCAVFKQKQLHKAFKDAFVGDDCVGPYQIVRQLAARPRQQPRRQRRSRQNQNYNNDDTFHPDDCSASEEDFPDE